MRLWEDAKRTKAQELIHWLLSAMVNGGWPIELVNLVALIELPASSSQSVSIRLLVTQALREMSKSDKKTVDDFEAILERQLRAKATAVARKQQDRWQFFIPIKIDITEEILRNGPRITILGKEFLFVPLLSVERRLDKSGRETLRNKRLLSIRTGANPSDLSTIFLLASGQGASWHLAWKDVEPAFDALRGMIELTFDFFGWSLISDGKKARRSVPHPLWMVARRIGERSAEWIHFITDEDSDAKPFELSKSRLIDIQKNASVLGKKPKKRSTLSLIADCLRLYSQAMDARFTHLSFLGFWQLGEGITNAGTVGGKTETVVNRLAWHGERIGLKGSGYKETLTLLRAKRNNIVHHGIHDIEIDDINIMKVACEAALDWLFRAHSSLPTISHVELFYRFREQSDTQINAMNTSIAYLKKGQRKRKR